MSLPEVDSGAVMSWLIPALVVFGIAAAAIAAIAVVVRIARRGRGARERADRELQTVGAKLVELDDAAAELELEVDMSSALYDGRPPASLRRARLTAQHTRDDAFAAYRDASADGALPAERRTAARKLTSAIDDALAVIASARAENASWVDAHASADEQVDAMRARIDGIRATMGDPSALRAELERIADESEWEDAAHADAAAREALEDAERLWREAREAASDPTRSAREALAASEHALVRADHSARMLEETHRLVANAALAVREEIQAARGAIRAAIGTQATLEPRDAERLAEAIRVAETALEQAERVADRRPVTANERIARLRDRLDMALADARTQQQRLRGARSALPGTLNAARSALARAEAVVTDAEIDARVRLDSARRELAAARQAHDPVEALDAARRAVRDAQDAAVLARFRKRRR